VGQHCAVAFGGGGAGTVVADNAAQVQHHGERERRVRWGSRRLRRGAASSSPVKADSGGVSGEIGGGRGEGRSEVLASEAGEPIPRRTGEVAACLSAGAKKRSRAERRAGRRPTERARAHGRGETREAGGPVVGTTWTAGTGMKRPAGHGRGTAREAGIGPRAAGRGRREARWLTSGAG
jgi:hypothetical protein